MGRNGEGRVRANARAVALVAMAALAGAETAACGGRQATLTTDALPLRRVVVYRNGVAYFERAGHVEESEVRFKMKESEVGDFLATLAVLERGGSSVRAASFPLRVDDPSEPAKPRSLMTADEKKGLKLVVLSLDGKAHDLQIGYVAESPLWRPSYRLVVRSNGEADLQAWGIVENLSGEDWRGVSLALVAGAPLAFESTLGVPVIPTRPTVTDNGEVISAVPRSETSLQQESAAGASPPPPPPPATAEMAEPEMDDEKMADRASDSAVATRPGAPPKAGRAATGGTAKKPSSAMAPMPMPAPVMKARQAVSAPRDVRSLAAVAAEGGTTRYDLPTPITVPDKSATMVMLLAKRVPGEAIFLFAPDGGVPDSSSHPFRVARFANKTGGAIEKGPIAVFEEGAFLGQGMVDPLPDGATTTVPFALERSIAVDQERSYDELGERVAKIENGELTVERDAVTLTKYRLRNGGEKPAKLLVKHTRINGARLFQPPPQTEDNVGAGSALVPATVPGHGTGELKVDERSTMRRAQDWFSAVADSAIKAYLADPRSDKEAVAKLTAAWAVRNEIVAKLEARTRSAQEQAEIGRSTEETRRNLKAIEKNKVADALRAKLTARLGEMALRLDEITKQMVEVDAKLAELRVRFKEALRDLKVTAPATPSP